MKGGIYGYAYLKHIIELWKGAWEEHLSNINEVVGKQNQHLETRKRWSVRIFLKNEF